MQLVPGKIELSSTIGSNVEMETVLSYQLYPKPDLPIDKSGTRLQIEPGNNYDFDFRSLVLITNILFFF